MKRIDLRKSKDFFADLKEELLSLKPLEVVVVLFEIGDFSKVEQSFAFVDELGCELMSSLKFNEVDWSLVIKKVKA